MKYYEPRYQCSDDTESPLIDRVLECIKEAMDEGETEHINEMLRFCPRVNLIQGVIPEDEWEDYATQEELELIYNGYGLPPHIKEEWDNG